MYGTVTNDESGPSTKGIDTKQTTRSSSKNTIGFFIVLLGTFGIILVAALLVTSSHPQNEEAVTLAAAVPSIPQPSSPSPPMKASLSQRGASIGQVRDDLQLYAKGMMDPYRPTDNPDGYLVMLVAENKLMWKEMAQKIEEIQASRAVPSWIFNYGPMGGEPIFKQSIAKMMQHWIDAPVNPDFLQFQEGAGSVLSQLSFLLTDPGDAVLTAAPGYMAFAGDFGVYASAKFFWIDADEDRGYVPTIQQLDETYSKAVEAGNHPRIFVICQPQNPTGVVYSKDAMIEMIDWALSKKDMHIVSDEIYALSTFPDSPKMISAADIMYEKFPNRKNFMGDYVHVVAGLSKDWGMSGFRVGSLFSHNADLLTAVDAVGYYSSPSRYMQFILQGVFDDDAFVSWYIAENRRRLYETYQALEEALSLIGAPLVPSQGAIFAWADFSSFILEGQTERDLWMELFDEAKVALTSGQSCQSKKPGMFRIVYGWPEGGVEAMEEFGRRLVQWKAARDASDVVYKAVDHPIDEMS